jgi:CRISPR/Cas system CMR-associated protein Cmr5 small subunit
VADAEFRNRGNADFPTTEQREERSRRAKAYEARLLEIDRWIDAWRAGVITSTEVKVRAVLRLRCEVEAALNEMA